MGGDSAPAETVAGAVDAAARWCRRCCCAARSERDAAASWRARDVPGIEIVDAPGRDRLSRRAGGGGARARPDSSLVVACREVREGRAQGPSPPGTTGAMLAASLLVDRAVSRAFPGRASPSCCRPATAPCLLIDAGANVEARPEHLLQFGSWARSSPRRCSGYERPAVGLLSVGEEAYQGHAVTLEAHALLAASDLNFAGNCEGRDALTRRDPGDRRRRLRRQRAAEGRWKGAGEMLFRELRTAADASLRAKLGGLLLMPALRGDARPRSIPRPTAAPTCWASAGCR